MNVFTNAVGSSSISSLTLYKMRLLRIEYALISIMLLSNFFLSALVSSSLLPGVEWLYSDSSSPSLSPPKTVAQKSAKFLVLRCQHPWCLARR